MIKTREINLAQFNRKVNQEYFLSSIFTEKNQGNFLGQY